MPHDRLLGPYPADGMTFASIFPPLPLAAIQPAAPGASRCARATMRWQDRVPGRAKARAISNPTDDPFDGRQPTSHERMTGLPWDASYHHGPAPWDTGRPQSAIVRLASECGFAGPVLDAGAHRRVGDVEHQKALTLLSRWVVKFVGPLATSVRRDQHICGVEGALTECRALLTNRTAAAKTIDREGSGRVPCASGTLWYQTWPVSERTYRRSRPYRPRIAPC